MAWRGAAKGGRDRDRFGGRIAGARFSGDLNNLRNAVSASAGLPRGSTYSVFRHLTDSRCASILNGAPARCRMMKHDEGIDAIVACRILIIARPVLESYYALNIFRGSFEWGW